MSKHKMKKKAPNTEEFNYCRGIAKKGSRSIYKSYRHLRRDKREGIYAIYAFKLEVDNILNSGNSEKFEIFMNKFNKFKDGWEIDEPMWIALNRCKNAYELEINVFQEFLEFHKKYKNNLNFKDDKELIEYMRGVSGNAALMNLPLISGKNKKSREGLEALGIAVELTSQLAKMRNNYDKYGFVFFSNEKCIKFKYSKSEMKGKKESLSFKHLTHYYGKIADEYFNIFLKNIRSFHKYEVFSLILTFAYYYEILNKIKKNNVKNFKKTIKISPLKEFLVYNRARGYYIKIQK